MDSLIIYVARYVILVPIIVTALILIKLDGRKRQKMLVMLFFAGVLSIVLAKIGAHFYNDLRPYVRDNTLPLFPHSGDPNGFPSDHTLLAAFLGFVALSYSKKAGVCLLIIAALIGWARVAANVHHGVDILGSFIITGLAYFIVASLLNNKKVADTLKITEHSSHKKQ